jgi:hypothetical protein
VFLYVLMLLQLSLFLSGGESIPVNRERCLLAQRREMVVVPSRSAEPAADESDPTPTVMSGRATSDRVAGGG